jgi:hypothetical protein
MTTDDARNPEHMLRGFGALSDEMDDNDRLLVKSLLDWRDRATGDRDEEDVPEAPLLISVSDKYVQCSLQTRNFERPGVAMSDCCTAPATTGVLFEDGKIMWRCKQHRGVRSLLGAHGWEYGPVVTEVLR